MAKQKHVASSFTVKQRKASPAVVASCTKSQLHTAFLCVAGGWRVAPQPLSSETSDEALVTHIGTTPGTAAGNSPATRGAGESLRPADNPTGDSGVPPPGALAPDAHPVGVPWPHTGSPSEVSYTATLPAVDSPHAHPRPAPLAAVPVGLPLFSLQFLHHFHFQVSFG